MNYVDDKEHIIFEYKHLCPYCGKELIEEEQSYGPNDYDTLYYCTCEESKLAYEIDKQMKELLAKRPKHKFKVVQTQKLIQI